MSILRLEGITKHYGRRLILDEVNLAIAAEERIALRGPNGSGKTTLLRIAAGTLRAGAGTKHCTGAIGYLPQDAPCYRELSVADHIRFASKIHGQPADQKDIIGQLINSGLERLANRPAGTLSRGQRQRLGLAMAFAGDPDLVILDEPTTALDSEAVEWLRTTLHDQSAAVLAAVHDDAPFTVDRTINLDGGRLQ
jgi:ABC-2 type transport system ATP-binding protein